MIRPTFCRGMAVIEKGLSNDLFLLFEYFGMSISCLVLSYITLWRLAFILNVSIALAIVLGFFLIKASDNWPAKHYTFHHNNDT